MNLFSFRAKTTKEKGGTPGGARQGNINMLNMVQSSEESNAAQPRKVVAALNFKGKLKATIENPPKASERWYITPEMAEIMLLWNDRNRPISATTVKDYAKLMKDGRWHFTGEPIVFSHKRLIDGQHRLLACIMSKMPIEALVVFGVPDEAFAYIDIGKARTASNIFAIHGVKNHAVMAAATQWVIGYETGAFSAAATGHIATDHAGLYEKYMENVGLQDSAWVSHVFKQARIVSPSMMCAIHYICARKSKAEADAFFRKVGEGIGFSSKKDPAYKLHKHFVDSAVAQERPGRKVAAAMTIKAWNATRLGRDVGALRYIADEAFPKVI